MVHTSSTHNRRIAKALSKSTGQHYQKCLQIVQQASERGLLGQVRGEEDIKREVSRLIKSGAEHTDILLGTEHGKEVLLPLRALYTHAMVLGSGGAGKTELLKTLSAQLLSLGWSGIYLDQKGDTAGIANPLGAFCQKSGINYQYLSTVRDTTTRFDVFANLGPRQVVDLANTLSRATFGKYYSQDLLLHKVTELTIRSNGVTLLQLYDELRKDPACNDMGGLVEALRKLLGYYKILRSSLPEDPLFKVPSSGLSYVGIDSLGQFAVSQLVSDAVMLQTFTSRHSNKHGSRMFLVIDGADQVNSSTLAFLLARARMYSLSIIIGAQSPLDFGDDFDQLAQNTNVFFVGRTSGTIDMKSCVKYFGEQDTKKFCSDLGNLSTGQFRYSIAQPKSGAGTALVKLL